MIDIVWWTPQAIADFYQKYVAQNEDGEWHMFDEKPELRKSERYIDRWVSLGEFYDIDAVSIENPESYDYEQLFTPVRNRRSN